MVRSTNARSVNSATPPRWGIALCIAVLLAVLPAAGSGVAPHPAQAQGGAAPLLQQRPLAVTPGTGFVGDQITITADGLPALRQVDLQWVRVKGDYNTIVTPDNVEYVDRSYAQERSLLGRTTTDAEGRLSAVFPVPEDHGETHDIYAVIDGQDVGRGGFRILRSITVSATEGPIGTPITITVKGMASSYYQSTMAVRWDNAYTGFISTVTTNGTGVATIRAAGQPGEHTLQVFPASHAVPYLNSHEGPNWHIFGHLPDKFVFNVTHDAGPPAATTEWPAAAAVAKLGTSGARTTLGDGDPGIRAVMEPESGPILSRTVLRADGLPRNVEVDLVWVTVRGNRASGSGWSLDYMPLGQATTSSNGTLRTDIEIPEDLGGWHTVRVVGGGEVLASAPYFVERQLLQAPPQQVRAGEQFAIQMKGIGWTELDNGVAVTYDNSYVGMACGFNSNGNITLYLTATGGPGTHLIDFYPMIYEGHPNKQVFDFEVPQLTALQDNPSLAIGSPLPIFRTAIEIVA